MTSVVTMAVGTHPLNSAERRRVKCEDNSRALVRLQDRRESFPAVMQQTLLIQVLPSHHHGDNISTRVQCPTCSPWSPQCCQMVSGWSVLANIVSANSDTVWNQALVRTLARIQYQVRLQPLSNIIPLSLIAGLCVSRDVSGAHQ